MHISAGKLVLVALTVTGICLIFASTSFADDVITNEKVQLPKLFDFAKFKSIFKRSYGSIAEEVARQKLFLARAFRSFMSLIKFRHNLSSYYLKVNSRSDWTKEEIKATLINKDPAANVPSTPGPEPLADEEDIARELAEIRSRAAEDGYKQIAETLEPTKGRGRRSVPEISNSIRDISLDDLEPVPDEGEEPPEVQAKIRPIIQSNNPEYQAPEHMSFGTDIDDYSGLHDDQFFQQINSLEAKSDSSTFSLKSFTDKIVKLFGFSRDEEKEKLPDEVFVDHRESNCLFEARNQRWCGSCYAFAFTALLEFLHCKATGQLTAFSEQYIIDCGYRYHKRNNGCDGAPMYTTAGFFVDYGIELRATYPYRAWQSKCPYPEKTPSSRMGYLKPNFKPYTISVSRRKLARVLKKTPIVVGIPVNNTDFDEYGGGVYDLNGCKNTRPDHAVLLVGHGRENGKEYWLMRNSHGLSFGRDGYFKLETAANCIFMEGYTFGNSTQFMMDPKINTKRYREGEEIEEEEKSIFKRLKEYGRDWI